ncbi:MAG: hypothetical protein IPH77_03415 [Ignavibacteria bacterium]|nr:hypothetical protein [Ignavibacteria bacterium]
MKDAYSLDATWEGFDKAYDNMARHTEIFSRDADWSLQLYLHSAEQWAEVLQKNSWQYLQ